MEEADRRADRLRSVGRDFAVRAYMSTNLSRATTEETIQGKKTADRDRAHDFIVQETLLRTVNRS